MSRFYKISLVAVAVVGLSGCASVGQEQNNMTAATAGSQTTNKVVIAGDRAVLGPAMAESIGKSMDEVDLVRLNRALETQWTGRTSNWVNPNTHNAYAMTPIRTYGSEDGKPCRMFTMTATMNGQQYSANGTACRKSNGIWETN